MSSSATPDFAARIAARYDELRTIGEDDLVGRLAEAGDVDGRRVLDIGCGTGTLAGALAKRGCEVWAVDPSAEMLAVGRSKALSGVRLELARAEALPFADESFERATMVSVVHHVDRPAAFAETYRVLEPDGRLVISNSDPDNFPHQWFMSYFPELIERDRRRIPGAATLDAELREAGFRPVQIERVDLDRRFDRDTALRRLRGRYISSFDLLTEEEYQAGLARAERELPAEVAYTFRSLLIVAVRPAR